jgi:ABC-type multidrug transport system fused ATPase/permease subunit
MFQTDFQYIHLSKVYRNEKNCLCTSSKITVVFAKMNVSNSRGNGPFLNNCSLNGEIYPLVKIPSTLAYASQLIACILSIVIVIATVVLNSLIVLTFWRVSRLRENVSLFLVMMLSLVDAATGIFCYPTLTLSQIYSLMESTECWIYDVKSKLFRPTSVLSLSVLAIISLERYFGVVHPFLHRTKTTKSNLSKLLLLIWLCCAVLSFPAYFNKNPLQIFGTISASFLVLITLCAYARIAFAIILSKIRQEKLRDEYANSENSVKKTRKEILHFLKQIHIAKSCFLIVLTYFLSYVPTLVVLGGLRYILPHTTIFFLQPWCVLSVMLNSVLNSIIFFWRSASLRNEAKNVLKNFKL